MIYILQYRGVSLISRAIQLVTWSQYSHSALALDDVEIIEAWEGGGVMSADHPWSNHTPGTVVDVFELCGSEEDYRAVWACASKKIGLKYDYLSLAGFLPLLRHWWKNSPDKYFCSHFVAEMCFYAGVPLFSDEAPRYKISPGKIPWSPRLRKIGSVSCVEEWEKLILENSPAQTLP